MHEVMNAAYAVCWKFVSRTRDMIGKCPLVIRDIWGKEASVSNLFLFVNDTVLTTLLNKKW